jgi:pSer/pThr/pTyr-binding forkhead associated (FHA) protein
MPPIYHLKLRFASQAPLSLSVVTPTVIGRAEADVNLNPFGAEELGVSRHHLEIVPLEKHLMIRDLNSTNGTFLNGVPCEPKQAYMLRSNDRLRLGRLELLVTLVKDEQIAQDKFKTPTPAPPVPRSMRPEAPPVKPEPETDKLRQEPPRERQLPPEVYQAAQILRSIVINREMNSHMVEYVAELATQEPVWQENPRLAVLRTACSFNLVARDNAELLVEERRQNKLKFGNIE